MALASAAAQIKHFKWTYCTPASMKSHTEKRNIASLQMTKIAECNIFGRDFHYDIPKYLLVRTKHICDLQNIGCFQFSTALEEFCKFTEGWWCSNSKMIQTARYHREKEAQMYILGWNVELNGDVSELLKGTCSVQQCSGNLIQCSGPLQQTFSMVHAWLVERYWFHLFVTVGSQNQIKIYK